MQAILHTWSGGRQLVDRLARSCPAEQADLIPGGFKNSWHWNVAHIVVTQQLLSYQLSGLSPTVSAELVAWCRKGTDACEPPPQQYTATVDLILPTVVRFQDDHAAGLFKDFQPYQTSAGIELGDLQQAMAFNNLHEGIHVGYLMAMRRSLPPTA